MQLVTMTQTPNKLPRRTALYNRTQSFGIVDGAAAASHLV